jgi:hypothetical protein
MRARLQQQPACQKRIDAYQHKADSVDAGPGGKLIDQRVIHLRVAQLVPGYGGDAGCGQLQRGPENRREGQRQSRAACGSADKRDSPAEEAEVKPQNHAVADEQQCRCHGRHIAVAQHGVANPVAVAHVPQHAAEIADEEAAAQGAGRGLFGLRGAGRRQKRPQQRDEAKPGEDRPPDGHRPGQRKGQLQHAGGENGRGPQLPGSLLPECALHTGPKFIAWGAWRDKFSFVFGHNSGAAGTTLMCRTTPREGTPAPGTAR